MKTFYFYGVCENAYKLDEKVWEAIEDPDDGYRSYLQSIEHVEDASRFTFYREPLAIVKVVVEGSPNLEGWKLVDVVDGHVWLEVGTCRTDDYYPSFVFSYHPSLPDNEWERFISED